MPSSFNSELLSLAEDVWVTDTSFHEQDFCIIAGAKKLTLPE